MFMACKLSAGDHDIRLQYHTPGLLPGFILSILGLVLLIILIRSEKKQKAVEKDA